MLFMILVIVTISAVVIPTHLMVGKPQIPSNIAASYEPMLVKIDGEEEATGIIIEKKANIYTVLTCWSVVNGTGQYTIETSDNQSYPVQKVTQLKGSDLAIISFNSNKTYPIVPTGNSDQLIEGNWVYYIGYPARIEGEKKRYIQFQGSAINRRLSADAIDGYQIMIRGAVSTGMKGSPLIDSQGLLVGIYGKFSIDPRTGTTFLYAIPINTAKKLAPGINWSSLPDLSSTSPLIPPLIVAGKYQPNGNYQDVEFVKLINSSLSDQYNNKLVRFKVIFDGIFNVPSGIIMENNYLKEYIFIMVSDELQGTGIGQIAIDKKYIDSVVKYKSGDIFLIEGFSKKSQLNLGLHDIFLEVHKIQKLGNVYDAFGR